MAAADYRLCDLCSGKAFYDSNLDYQFAGSNDYSGNEINEDNSARIAGEKQPWGYKLQHLGDWAVLCDECARTHKTQIVLIDVPSDGGGGDDL